MLNASVEVENFCIQETMLYKKKELLSYKIEYPQFKSLQFLMAVNRINLYYKNKALEFERYCRTKLFCLAVDQYKYSIENNFPVQKYEAIVNYVLSYNQNCAISLYFNQYIYTGGAHGTTLRYSDTWNLQTGRTIPLKNLFARNINYRDYIIKNITAQVKEQIKNGENVYFDDYEQNISQYLNEESFYITQKGLVIYYQQYDIAPYSSGIPEFLIPYAKGILMPPRCY